MEYIEGFVLADLGTLAPTEVWQFAGDETIRTVHAISDRGSLNEDVNRSSFTINPSKDFEVRMTDSALCRFRREHGEEEDWRHWQAHQDEDSAAGPGRFMERRLQGTAPRSFMYHRSNLYKMLDYDFMKDL